MRLTLHTDYAFRTLIYLAVHDDRLVPLAEVARVYAISSNHLVKVIHGLGQAGIIQTVRGRAGGLRLARPPEDIRLGDVVRHTEGDLSLIGCMRRDDPDTSCVLAGGCAMKGALHKGRVAFMGVLDSQTLANVITPYERKNLIERAGKVKKERTKINAAP